MGLSGGNVLIRVVARDDKMLLGSANQGNQPNSCTDSVFIIIKKEFERRERSAAAYSSWGTAPARVPDPCGARGFTSAAWQ
jgi:hypothetical protein